MKPALQQLQTLCPAVEADLIREHLRRLDEEYFERFSLSEIAKHLERLGRLSRKNPVEVILKRHDGQAFDCTVLAFDYDAEFSLIAGILFGNGVNIQSGDVFTYAKARQQARPRSRRFPWTRGQRENLLSRRRIIDHIVGRLVTTEPWEDWSTRFIEQLQAVISLLEAGDKASIEEAKHRVNERVTRRLVDSQSSGHDVLYPVSLEIDTESSGNTRLKVESQDTPAFLYALTTALSLHQLSIDHVQIRTSAGHVADEIDIVGPDDQPVTDPRVLDKIRLSVVLTKQFTYFLDRAPDPYSALSRFEQLVVEILRLPEGDDWAKRLSNPKAMKHLARLLGASDFLWEDFIRLQYEALLPVLASASETSEASTARHDAAELSRRLEQGLESCGSLAERIACVNKFKDREIFRLDLDHILDDSVDFRQLAEQLTELAEIVIQAIADILYAELLQRHGTPRTVAGLPASYAVFGLGKLGGAALGYASDIELLLVYSDTGTTDGDNAVSNAEFFSDLMREIAQAIQAKREGIFHVDLRLRPYGNAGPMACSLANFCEYYGPGGAAHSFERLALVRLRAVAGDRKLGSQVTRLRDEFIYRSPSIVVEELQELRARQFEEKNEPGRYNAKFSPGALVDLEYTVQILQLHYASEHDDLRTPRIHKALNALQKAGVLEPIESERLTSAYDFLRRLINGLRMLRGSAKDLFLPPSDSIEFVHLARRMGYQSTDGLGPADQLLLEFSTQTATVRTFVEKRMGRAALPGPLMGNIADLILSDDPAPELCEKVLRDAGFKHPQRALAGLQALAARTTNKRQFARLAVLAVDKLRREPNPDMALNNLDRFGVDGQDHEAHYAALLEQPTRLEILLGIFSRSQFLADVLIRNREFYDWVTTPQNLHEPRKRSQLVRELRARAEASDSHDAWLGELRLFRRRELLRIGTRDMFLRVSTPEVMQELTTLAEALVDADLEQVWKELVRSGQVRSDELEALASNFSVLAFGKLGGRELNYSSDIDLIGIYHDTSDVGTPAQGTAVEPNPFAAAMSMLREDLSKHTEEGYAYRVDLRLRPYGRSGELVSTVEGLVSYYEETARVWEIQALLKLRPIAGNLDVGYELLERLYPVLVRRRDPSQVTLSIQELREEAIRNSQTRTLGSGVDVKNGPGGIRDVEFLVQGLQLIHVADHPTLLGSNTLQVLRALEDARILDAETCSDLRRDYLFLRRVEHYLQILHDRQIHSLPVDVDELEALARRVLGRKTTAAAFTEELQSRFDRIYATHVARLFPDRTATQRS